MVIEKTTPATLSMLMAMAVSTPRAPSGLTVKMRGATDLQSRDARVHKDEHYSEHDAGEDHQCREHPEAAPPGAGKPKGSGPHYSHHPSSRAGTSWRPSHLVSGAPVTPKASTLAVTTAATTGQTLLDTPSSASSVA